MTLKGLYRNIILIMSMLFSTVSFAQYLSSSRSLAIGASGAIIRDLSAIDWNPAGLNRVNDWVLGISNYILIQNKNGIYLQSVEIGKRIFSHQVFAVRYSPSKVLEFVVPSTLTIYDSLGNNITAKYDRQVLYRQYYSLGYNYQILDNFSIGTSARFYESKVSDTKYLLDTSYHIQSQKLDYTNDRLLTDVGILWEPQQYWSFGITLKNLVQFRWNDFNEELKDYNLEFKRSAIFSAGYKGCEKLILGIEGDTKNSLRAGAELLLPMEMFLRAGMYINKLTSANIEAFSVGYGMKYDPVEFDLSYIRFQQNSNRSGSINVNTFKNTSFTDIDFTPFTKDRISFSVNVNLGKSREILASIEYVEMFGEIFTASYQTYAFNPIGKAKVCNISSQPITAKVSFFIPEIMNAPTETQTYTMTANETLEIPFYAVFSDKIRSFDKYSIYDGTVFVHAELASDYDDSRQTRVVVRGRNDWNGDVQSLKYFVTPDDADIVKYTRNTLNKHKDKLDSIPELMQNLEKARITFNDFSSKLLYVSDPQKSQDYVQYPSQTLALHSGDCDDLSVFYASILLSMGIPAAFIDIVPPDNPDSSHIYLMFDSGISAENAQQVSNNPKRFVIQKNNKGYETVWIPIETTIVNGIFDEAWSLGAEQYYRDSEINLGLIKGWMRVIDIKTYY